MRWITDDRFHFWVNYSFVREVNFLYKIVSFSVVSDAIFCQQHTLTPSSCRNGITCIRFGQILPFSVQIPPLLLYFVFVCVRSGIRAVVLFLAPACVSTVGAEIQWCRRYSTPWCSFMVLHSHFLLSCILLQVQLGYVHTAIAMFLSQICCLMKNHVFIFYLRHLHIWKLIKETCNVVQTIFNFHYWSKVWGQ